MKKIILAFMLILTVVFTNSLAFAKEATVSKTSEKKFSDISKHWAEASINKIVDKKTFAGKDGKFLPDKAIKRSEFVLMLHKALELNINYFKAPDIAEYFDDVKNEDAYASALYDLVTVDIIDYKGHFKPNSTLSREEMVHYIMKAYRYKMGDDYKMIKIVVKPFADDKQINPAYSGEIARAAHMGIIKRSAKNLFHPKENSTRAQAATVIDRLLTQLDKEIPKAKVTPSVELKDGLLIMKLTITNTSKAPITINHSSGQKADFKLLDSDRNILYTWSADKMFIMALTKSTIEPGKSLELTGEVEKELIDSFKEKAAYMQAYITGTSNEFVINPNGYETEVTIK